jgi:hypothetical protein
MISICWADIQLQNLRILPRNSSCFRQIPRVISSVDESSSSPRLSEQRVEAMLIIHFTEPAADPLETFDATAARFVPLMEGQGNSHVSCLHLDSNARIASPSLTHAAALLVVYGRITVTTQLPTIRMDIHAGMGCVFDAGELYTIESATGAIVIIVEADQLAAHERGISRPEPIAGARWPSDAVLTS